MKTANNHVVRTHHQPASAVARLSSERRSRSKRFGMLKDKIWIASNFDKTPEKVINAFEGNS